MKKISEIMNETNRASLVNNKLMEQFEANRNKVNLFFLNFFIKYFLQ